MSFSRHQFLSILSIFFSRKLALHFIQIVSDNLNEMSSPIFKELIIFEKMTVCYIILLNCIIVGRLKDMVLHNSNCLFRFFYSVGFAMAAHCSIEMHKNNIFSNSW